MSKFNKGDHSPINQQDSNELKNLKKLYNDTVTQRKLMDKQSTAIDSIKFFSELYVIHNDIVYLKHIITETNIALKTISELLLMKTELTTEDIEKSLLDLAKDLGSFKKYIEKEYEVVNGK